MLPRRLELRLQVRRAHCHTDRAVSTWFKPSSTHADELWVEKLQQRVCNDRDQRGLAGPDARHRPKAGPRRAHSPVIRLRYLCRPSDGLLAGETPKSGRVVHDGVCDCQCAWCGGCASQRHRSRPITRACLCEGAAHRASTHMRALPCLV